MSHSSPSTAYRPDIDGLRALAVLAVLGFHAFPGVFKSGFIGVDIFFVISGYLIGSLVLSEVEAGRFSFLRFYDRRIRRLFPALFLVMSAVLLFGWFALFPKEYAAAGKQVFGGAFFVDNFFFWQEAGYFDVSSHRKPLLHLWSLGIEEQFYLIFPFCVVFLTRRRWKVTLFLLAAWLFSFGFNLSVRHSHPDMDFYSPFSRFWEPLTGVLLCAGQRYLGRFGQLGSGQPGSDQTGSGQTRRAEALSKRWGRLEPGTLLALLGLILLAVGFVRCEYGRHAHPGSMGIFPVLGTVCLLAAGAENPISRRLFANRAAVWIGLISYPLYLWHWPLLAYFRIIWFDIYEEATLLRLILLLVAVALASLTYRYVERPIRFGHGSGYGSTGRRAVVLAGLVAVLGLGGLTVWQGAGLPERASMREWIEVDRQFVYPPISNEAARGYPGVPPDLAFCRFADVGARETVALIGDSHAWVTFHGLAELGKKLGCNTLFLGCRLNFDVVLPLLENDASIRKVFIVTRGLLYFDEYHNYDRFFRPSVRRSPEMEKGTFFGLLQNCVDRLTARGKKVCLVAEVPEMLVDLSEYRQRPIRRDRLEIPLPAKELVLRRQGEYLESLKAIRGGAVIETIDAFCPQGECFAYTPEGLPSRFDDNHLSFAGSEFLAEKVLKPWLLE